MKILLVDDERTEREGIRFLIEKFQFELEVAEAANGKLAMEYLQKYQDVDILLTDVKMPYMDGLQLAKYAKENRLTVKFTSLVLWLIPHAVWPQNPARCRLILVRSQLLS